MDWTKNFGQKQVGRKLGARDHIQPVCQPRENFMSQVIESSIVNVSVQFFFLILGKIEVLQSDISPDYW